MTHQEVEPMSNSMPNLHPPGFRIGVTGATVGLSLTILLQTGAAFWWASGVNKSLDELGRITARLEGRDELNRTTAELARALQDRVQNLERNKDTTFQKLDTLSERVGDLTVVVRELKVRIEEDTRGRKGASYDPPERSGGAPRSTLGPR